MTLKKCKLLFIVMFAVVVSAVSVHAEEARLVATFSHDIESIDTSELRTRIDYARARLDETRLAETGVGIPTTSWWATQLIRSTFSTAITNAETELERLNRIGYFSAGNTFDMTLSIENNPGFATLGGAVFVPEGLVLTHIHNLSDELRWTMPNGYSAGTGAITPPVNGPAWVYIGLFATENFTTPPARTPLFRYTFAVPANATPRRTTAIMYDFATTDPAGVRHFFEMPKNADGYDLSGLPTPGRTMIVDGEPVPDLTIFPRLHLPGENGVIAQINIR